MNGWTITLIGINSGRDVEKNDDDDGDDDDSKCNIEMKSACEEEG